MFHLNGHWAGVIWRPDTSDRVVDRLHRLGLRPELLAIGISQQNSLLQNRVWGKVAHANGLLASVDVCALNDWVLIWAWGDGDFDGWVGFGKLWQGVADKQAECSVRYSLPERSLESAYLTSFPWSYRPSRSSGSRASCIGE